MEFQPPFEVGKEPAVPHLFQQTSQPVIQIESTKVVETSDGSESQQGQQAVQALRMNPRMTIARFETLRWQLTKVCMQL